MRDQIVDLETFLKYRKDDFNFKNIEKILEGYNYKIVMSIDDDGSNSYDIFLEYKENLYICMERSTRRRIRAHDYTLDDAFQANIQGYLGYVGEFLYSFDIEEGFIPVCEKKQIINEFVPYDSYDLYDTDVEDDDGNIIEPGIANVTVHKGRMGRYEDLKYTIKLLVRKISDEKETKEDEEYIKNLNLTEEDIDKIISMQNELFKENEE